MDLLNEELNQVDVEVSTKIPLTNGEKTRLRETLEKRLGKKVNLTFLIDKGIIGGIRLRHGDNILDGTVNSQLNEMFERMVA